MPSYGSIVLTVGLQRDHQRLQEVGSRLPSLIVATHACERSAAAAHRRTIRILELLTKLLDVTGVQVLALALSLLVSVLRPWR